MIYLVILTSVTKFNKHIFYFTIITGLYYQNNYLKKGKNIKKQRREKMAKKKEKKNNKQNINKNEQSYNNKNEQNQQNKNDKNCK